jgi:hypothetical protein
MTSRPVAGLLAAALIALPAAAHEGHGVRVQAVGPAKAGAPKGRQWLAGDHHVHSEFSAAYKPSPDGRSPPTPVAGGDSRNTIPTNARMGARHGLSWMVATDHGGPNHAQFSREKAYPELLRARREVPGLLLFVGMELNTPAAEHSSVIIPRTPAERDQLFGIESRFDRTQPWPADPARSAEGHMLEALRHMGAAASPPVVIANHPSRTATGVGAYGLVSPHELRNWNDTAPTVAVGMEGAPGHQANALRPDGSLDGVGLRGVYGRSPTMGGFDQMTARLGGFWDSMLGEGRRFWITSTSDSHRHYTDGGNDFWPGEYSKTYVRAARTHADVLDGLRNGRVFVTLGDLISELDVEARVAGRRAEIGGTLKVPRGSDVVVTIRVRDPAGQNFAGRSPQVARVDLIRGEVTGPVSDRSSDRNPTTRVEKRFAAGQWAREGERLSMTWTLRNVTADGYVRVRGTGGSDLEPAPDTPGEDPWGDLWFYSNPVFIDVE